MPKTSGSKAKPYNGMPFASLIVCVLASLLAGGCEFQQPTFDYVENNNEGGIARILYDSVSLIQLMIFVVAGLIGGTLSIVGFFQTHDNGNRHKRDFLCVIGPILLVLTMILCFKVFV